MYYWINGQTFVGPETQNANYSAVRPVTWENFMRTRSVEQLAGSYSSLS